jgi:hypothetical protein
LAALVGAALFPQVAYVDAPFKKAKGGAPAVPCGPEAVKLLVRDPAGALLEPGSKACVHPSSVGAKLGGAAWPSPFVAFHERVLTTKVRTRDSRLRQHTPATCLRLLATLRLLSCVSIVLTFSFVVPESFVWS